MGGWASLKTQDTKINPSLIDKVIEILSEFENDFNKWLNWNYCDPIQFICPVGSSAYYLIDAPDIEYGDIDYLVEFPYIKGNFNSKRDYENKSVGFYKKKLMEFVNENTFHYIETEDTLKSNGNYLILKLLTGEIVQVDLIATLSNYTQWNIERFTPQHGLKGIISGAFFSTLNEVYKINIGDRGLTLRLKDGKLVSGNIRKDVIIKTISTNYYTFWKDLLIWVMGRFSTDKPIISPLLQAYPGIEDNMLPSVMLGFKGFVFSLEENDLIGNIFFPEPTAKQILERITIKYNLTLDEILDNPKYHKADTIKIRLKIKNLKEQIKLGKRLATKFMLE